MNNLRYVGSTFTETPSSLPSLIPTARRGEQSRNRSSRGGSGSTFPKCNLGFAGAKEAIDGIGVSSRESCTPLGNPKTRQSPARICQTRADVRHRAKICFRWLRTSGIISPLKFGPEFRHSSTVAIRLLSSA